MRAMAAWSVLSCDVCSSFSWSYVSVILASRVSITVPICVSMRSCVRLLMSCTSAFTRASRRVISSITRSSKVVICARTSDRCCSAMRVTCSSIICPCSAILLDISAELCATVLSTLSSTMWRSISLRSSTCVVSPRRRSSTTFWSCSWRVSVCFWIASTFCSHARSNSLVPCSDLTDTEAMRSSICFMIAALLSCCFAERWVSRARIWGLRRARLPLSSPLLAAAACSACSNRESSFPSAGSISDSFSWRRWTWRELESCTSMTCLSMSREGASAEICAESFSICVLVCSWLSVMCSSRAWSAGFLAAIFGIAFLAWSRVGCTRAKSLSITLPLNEAPGAVKSASFAASFGSALAPGVAHDTSSVGRSSCVGPASARSAPASR
mmetsp:Transcript_52975/g.124098  ORF Transcript_52975/g.124098 Transcript_52975/m.124098 type:complete len:384 (+) Transcript_52975:220-1371(+)